MKQMFYLTTALFFIVTQANAQAVDLQKNNLEPVNVFMSNTELDGDKVIRLVKDSAIEEYDEPTFVKIKDIDFENGTIEIKVLSRLLPNAPDLSRGFIGLAFHINENNSSFESIYIRPTNARADNQVRRNHSIQYFAYPSYKFQLLREKFPEMYESYSDFGLNEWITMRIDVEGEKAKLYINNNKYPSLVVNDLKLGGNRGGAIGVFVDVGTEGFFKDLQVIKK